MRLHKGLQGTDWDAVAFEIGAGQSAAITVINKTQDERSGNTAYLDIYVNGQFQTGTNTDGHSFGTDARKTETTFIERDQGHYVVEIDCSNRNATSDVCSIVGTGVAITHIN